MTTDISIVVPCYNERENVPLFFYKIEKALSFSNWEIIFVDDNSPDGTIEAVRELSRFDPRVRGIRRIGRRGLSSAVIEGAMSSSAPLIAVMDGDLQHDEHCLVPMISSITQDGYDLVVASRYLEGGSNGGLTNSWRRFLSNAGRWLARIILRISLSDPMSGFFVIQRQHFDNRAEKLSRKGFKILLDLILSDRAALKITEVPMVFRPRLHGSSKLDWKVMLSFMGLVIRHMKK
ncbi:glycosyltransferase [Saccharibacter sp. 17.LH.SD]|uniref:polyprenol monophosphomannose synthase n=1 Tax=Saccharibacter sp. 17.LH.SD TaxID=2689393 RepID=UPI00136C0F65|nr:polyprenol monophosphomannose synthase [Saccharibacter sp. 17.LH.SD]MXV45053.1 glycosyltransferase [Saccharibacter sp. 17.LH.SD]